MLDTGGSESECGPDLVARNTATANILIYLSIYNIFLHRKSSGSQHRVMKYSDHHYSAVCNVLLLAISDVIKFARCKVSVSWCLVSRVAVCGADLAHGL